MISEWLTSVPAVLFTVEESIWGKGSHQRWRCSLSDSRLRLWGWLLTARAGGWAHGCPCLGPLLVDHSTTHTANQVSSSTTTVQASTVTAWGPVPFRGTSGLPRQGNVAASRRAHREKLQVTIIFEHEQLMQRTFWLRERSCGSRLFLGSTRPCQAGKWAPLATQAGREPAGKSLWHVSHGGLAGPQLGSPSTGSKARKKSRGPPGDGPSK